MGEDPESKDSQPVPGDNSSVLILTSSIFLPLAPACVPTSLLVSKANSCITSPKQLKTIFLHLPSAKSTPVVQDILDSIQFPDHLPSSSICKCSTLLESYHSYVSCQCFRFVFTACLDYTSLQKDITPRLTNNMPEPVPMTLPSSLKWSACNNIWSFFVSMFRLGVSFDGA